MALMGCTELSLVLNWSVKDVHAWAMLSPLLQNVRCLELGQDGTIPLFPDQGEVDCYTFLLCTWISAPPRLKTLTVRDAWLGLLPAHSVTVWRRINGVQAPINIKFSNMVSRMRLTCVESIDFDRCSVFPDGLDQSTMLGEVLSTVPPPCVVRVRIGKRVLHECHHADHSYGGLMVRLFHSSTSVFGNKIVPVR